LHGATIQRLGVRDKNYGFMAFEVLFKPKNIGQIKYFPIAQLPY
jgi:hypothetical protein